MSSFGSRIKSIRQNTKLNQQDFAKLLGLSSYGALSNYESGRREPELSILIKIAEIGKVSLDWLLTGKEEKPTIQTEQAPENQKIKELLEENENLKKQVNYLLNEVIKYKSNQ